MARIRTIKPEFWTNEGLSALPEATHLLAAALLNYSDDDGYFNANLGLVKAACSPLRDPTVTISESINLLCSIGYIRLGKCGSKMFGQIINFKSHQTISHPKESKIKGLSIEWCDSSNVPVTFHDQSILNREQGTGNREMEQGTFSCGLAATQTDDDGTASSPTDDSDGHDANGNEANGKELPESVPTERSYPEPFEQFWNAYPNRGGRKRGKRKSFSLWKLVHAADRQALVQAANAYAASRESQDGFARDPERFFKDDWWRDWIEDAVASTTSRVPSAEDLANWNPVDGGQPS